MTSIDIELEKASKDANVNWVQLGEMFAQIKAANELFGRPCMIAQEGQALMWLNCHHCGFAHARWGNP